LDIKVTKLQEVLELLKPAVPKKSALKAVSYVHLGDGKAVATDLETMIIVNLPEAKDQMLLPFSAISAMLKYVSGNLKINIEQKGKAISLSWNGGSANYPTEDVADFPILPEIKARAEGLIDGDALIAAMNAALPYVAVPVKNASGRPTLEGITLVLGTPMEVAAGDGFRMSHQALGLSFPLEEKVIVPAHSVAILEHVFKKTPRTPPNTADSLIKVVTAKRQLRMALIDENKMRLDFGTSASVVLHLIAGKPPEWLALVPKGEPILQSQIFALQMEAAVKRVKDVAKAGSDIVRMEFADGKLKISAKHDGQEISSTIDTMLTHGEPGRLGINQNYLLDYLNGKQGIITFSKYTDYGPVVFEYQKSPRVLIMPMQVQWGDEPAPPEKPAETVEPQAEATESDTEETESESSTEEEATEPETEVEPVQE
jgi:DNA polymerase III sliding clamp (beta) subunit (PCNA family)